MTKKEIEQLRGEGIELRHWFDKTLSPEACIKINRIIDIELLLDRENNK